MEITAPNPRFFGTPTAEISGLSAILPSLINTPQRALFVQIRNFGYCQNQILIAIQRIFEVHKVSHSEISEPQEEGGEAARRRTAKSVKNYELGITNEKGDLRLVVGRLRSRPYE